MNATQKNSRCFPDEMMLLMTDTEKRINQLLFPVQFLVAVIGNSLTMSVLLSAHMKNRANHLLAFLALCDMLVFVMMFPHYLTSLDVFAHNMQFRLLHFNSKVHFAALTNWFSAAAIWFVLAVSVERLLIVKFPFRSLDNYNSRQIVFISMCILVGTFLLTSYHHVSHTCKTFAVCSGTQLIGGCYSNALDTWGARPNPTSVLTRQWIEMSVILNAVFAVLLPVFAVAVLNISLVRLLKKRNTQDLLVQTVSTNPSARHEQERKMTHTVLAIVTCFSLTQGPSALVFIYQLLYPSGSTALQTASIVANQLVLTGKMLNVVLFCMTSSTFRRKLLQTCKRWMLLFLYCNRQSGIRSGFSRSQSKSQVTQKTSLVYSPSSRARSMADIEMSLKKKFSEFSQTTTNGESVS
ncbi:G-protein coupled receptor [Trichostrongylus colubriformis]|uniref:G-protein coupled receptor n=1 Tax=Trichostrongylus colubriformis TaxID=6319 RepID=A0AAN8FWX7_TRICO